MKDETELYSRAWVSLTHEPYVLAKKGSIARLELQVSTVGGNLTVEQAATEIIKLLNDDDAFAGHSRQSRALLSEVRRQLKEQCT